MPSDKLIEDTYLKLVIKNINGYDMFKAGEW